MTKAVIYSRVSTDDQHTENQDRPLMEWAFTRGLEIVGRYSESASAWKDGHQKELSRLIQDAGRRRFDVVLVWSLDRLSRQGVLAVLGLIERLRVYGIRILSYQEAWTDVPGPMAEVLYAITAWAARYESQRRSERVKAGLSRAVKEGRKLGRPIGSKDSRKRKRSSKNSAFGS